MTCLSPTNTSSIDFHLPRRIPCHEGGSSGTSLRTMPTVLIIRPNSSQPMAWQWWVLKLGRKLATPKWSEEKLLCFHEKYMGLEEGFSNSCIFIGLHETFWLYVWSSTRNNAALFELASLVLSFSVPSSQSRCAFRDCLSGAGLLPHDHGAPLEAIESLCLHYADIDSMNFAHQKRSTFSFEFQSILVAFNRKILPEM